MDDRSLGSLEHIPDETAVPEELSVPAEFRDTDSTESSEVIAGGTKDEIFARIGELIEERKAVFQSAPYAATTEHVLDQDVDFLLNIASRSVIRAHDRGKVPDAGKVVRGGEKGNLPPEAYIKNEGAFGGTPTAAEEMGDIIEAIDTALALKNPELISAFQHALASQFWEKKKRTMH